MLSFQHAFTPSTIIYLTTVNISVLLFIEAVLSPQLLLWTAVMAWTCLQEFYTIACIPLYVYKMLSFQHAFTPSTVIYLTTVNISVLLFIEAVLSPQLLLWTAVMAWTCLQEFYTIACIPLYVYKMLSFQHAFTPSTIIYLTTVNISVLLFIEAVLSPQLLLWTAVMAWTCLQEFYTIACIPLYVYKMLSFQHAFTPSTVIYLTTVNISVLPLLPGIGSCWVFYCIFLFL